MGRPVKPWMALPILATWWAIQAAASAWSRWGCRTWTSDCRATFWRGVEDLILFQWVKDPEALVAAMLAVGAAAVGAYYLQRQILQAEQLSRRNRKREHRAARAMLPLALSEVCDFAQGHIVQWISVDDHGRRVEQAQRFEEVPNIELRFPRVSQESLSTFRDVIQSAPSGASAHFEDILSEIQVAIARSRRAEATVNDQMRRAGRVEIFGQVIELAQLYAKATGLLDYARREGPLPAEIEPTQREVRTALRSMGWWEPSGPLVWEAFDRRYPEDQATPVAG